jgi:MFS family permease
VTRYFIFAVTSLSFLLIAISNTMVSVAFPEITSEFNVSLILAGWVLGINQLVATVFMPLGGKAGEIWGIKRVYVLSIAVFIAGSFISAIAPNIWILIGGRFLQATGLGTILPLATVIVSDEFPDNRQQVIGLFTSFLPIGNIVGPNIGGWMVESFGWRSTFWLNIPLGLIVIFVSMKLLKSKKGDGGKMDLLGTGYFTGGLTAFLVALSTLGDVKNGGAWLISLALFAAAVISLIAFYQREGRVENPMIDLEFIKSNPFLAANVFNLFYGMAALGIMQFIPLFATSVYGMSTIASGVILTPLSAGMLIGSIITSIMLPKWGYRGPMLTGTGIIVFCLIMLGLEPSKIIIFGIQLSDAVVIGVILFLTGLGMGIISPAANNACIDLLPQRIGTITGLRGMFRQGGSAISIALTSLLLEVIPDMNRGFTVVFYGLAVILLITTPVIFLMPKSAKESCPMVSTEEISR